jgi:asparagine synthase (glutamine-hydrolysing)
MSAIFGVLRFDGEAVAARDLERMGNALVHRGPDGRKIALDGCAAVGNCLMRVNQEDLFEAQPIRERSAGLILTVDCRIDNREELAEQTGVSTAALRDMPDSALVLRAYKQWGEDCARHLLGDFAFAIWDRDLGKLMLARDHMGQRNIFYHRGEDFFAFATEIKALWALADVPHQLLDQEIARFFYRDGAPRTEGATRYAGICAVPGGTIVTAALDGTVTRRRYWEAHADPVHACRDEPYYIEKYRAVLAEAVACRLRRLTGPAALSMSAGFDTAAIAGLAAPVVTAQGRKLVSLSWLGEASVLTTRGDIRPWLEACRRVMPHLDVREFSHKGQDPLARIERLFLAHDGPGSGDRMTSGRLFAEASALGARLIMDGYGGDYTLNPRGRGALARHLRKGRWVRFFAEFRAHRRETGQPVWLILKHEVVQPLLPQSFVRWQREIRQIGSQAWAATARRSIGSPYLEALRARNASEAGPGRESIPLTAMRAHIRHSAANISRGPAAANAVAAAAHGLDLSRPFHDKRVVELGLAVPEDLYVKNGRNRHLARQALADVYPPEFQRRGRANEGELSDVAILDMATSTLPCEAERLAKNPKLAAYFDFELARRILAEPEQHGPAAATSRHAAVRALLTARFVEWFSGSNVG